MSFSGVDFLGIEDMLSEDERAVRDLVRDFVDAEVLPIIEACAYEGRFPKELIPQMAAMNLFGSTIHEYGLPGLNNVAYGLITQELERGDSGLRSFVSVQSALVMFPIYTLRLEGAEGPLDPGAREGRGDRLLRPHGARLRLEPGRDAHGREEGREGLDPERREGVDHERLDRGRRGRVGEGRRADGPIRGFLVEKGMKGFTAPEHRMKMSLRASVTSQLVVRGRPRSPRRTSCPASKGIKGPLSCLTQARYGIAWGGIGSAMATYDVRARLREVPQAVQGPPDRVPPARPGRSSPS